MGIFNKFKKPKEDRKDEVGFTKKGKEEKTEIKAKDRKKDEPVKKVEKLMPKETGKKSEIRGKTKQAYRILIKPLVTEKASHLGPLNKYIFAIDPKMNKIEVKKAIRTIYNVEPVKVNVSNFFGKNIRQGKISGRTKNWKKAIVTLRQGDIIKVYEGV